MGGRVGEGGQGGCERRIKVFVKIKKNIFGGGGSGRGWGRGGGGQVGGGGGVAGVRVGVKVELKLVWKCKKKIGEGGAGLAGNGGVEGWGLVDREGVGWQQCLG